MAGPKDSGGFLRKVVRFVANPATDWRDLGSKPQEPGEQELERSELKAMVERKRRNDFVRRREFDMLRRVRREGLTPEQLAALGGSSRLDDSDVRAADQRPRHGVKAKIDAIEQQMVGETVSGATPPPVRRGGGSFFAASTQALPMRESGVLPPGAVAAAEAQGSEEEAKGARTLPPLDLDADDALPALPPLAGAEDEPPAGAGAAPAVMASGLPPLAHAGTPAGVAALPSAGAGAPPAAAGRPATSASPAAGIAPAVDVEVSEVVHDPELDEAVIAFANADFDQCEQALVRLTRPFGPRAQHAETWLVLFDLYRATGQQQPFESLAVEYAHQFGSSAPQWYSLPRLVAEAVADESPAGRGDAGRGATSAGDGAVGWVAPPVLDVEALSRLRSQTLQMPLPWVFDWRALRGIEPEAATQLSVLCRVWAGQALEMRWIGGDRLFAVLQEAAPTGVRDADPAFWLARLDALRLTHRADQFDEAAIDYCVTYEVSPPAWEPARCNVRFGDGDGVSTRPPPMSVFSEVSTSFLESGLSDEHGVELARVELSGQLVGDIGETLRVLTARLGAAPMVAVSCARLIRVDFLAAGDLLNWVLTLRGEQRTVQFADAHRLVALFFGAMGINEHAQVQVRRV
ncbi:MAG: STAS domain-containing protein [Burkholderiales bacterium]|nr:STAS domain-containing protein [Burkholderiales bacterium]